MEYSSRISCTSHATSVILPLLYILAAVTRYFTTKRQEDNYKKSERDAAEKKKRALYERKKEVCY